MDTRLGARIASRSTWLALALLGTVIATPDADADHAASVMGDPTMPWAIHLQIMGDAVKVHDFTGAARAWREAHGSAMHGRRWEGLIAVADARLQLGRADRFPMTARAEARELYLAALFRARQEGSLHGVLAAARAFAALDDEEVVRQAFRIALEVAGRDGEAQARVRALAAEFKAVPLAAEAREGR